MSEPSAASWWRPVPAVAPERDPHRRRLLVTELLVVFTVSLGLSAVRSVLALLDALASPQPLNRRRVSLAAPQAHDPWVDLASQLVSGLQLVAWAALGLLMLLRAGSGPRAIGLDAARPGRDARDGLLLAAGIGVPGLAFYLAARAAGLNLTVVPSTLGDHWWRIPVLVLTALANAWAEEILVVGYLLTALRRLGLGEQRGLLVSAVLRGSYHLYQGVGAGIGNVVMGLVFGRYWQSRGRTWPLVAAHTLIDVVALVGSALLVDRLPFLRPAS